MKDPEPAAWAAELRALPERGPRVHLKPMIGSYAIKTEDRMFAFPHRVGVVLKLDPEAGRRLVARPQAEPFVHMGRRFGDGIWMPARTPGGEEPVGGGPGTGARPRPDHAPHVASATRQTY